MKPTKKIAFKYLLYIWGKDWLLTFVLVGFSLNSSAQLHISDNTVLTVSKNTVLYIINKSPEEVIQNKVPLVKANEKQKKTKKPLQPPMVKGGTDPENKVSALSFTSIPEAPYALYFFSRIKKAAIVQTTTNFLIKAVPVKKSHNILISFFPNDCDSQIRIFLNDFLLSREIYFEENITRPPPFSSLGSLLI